MITMMEQVVYEPKLKQERAPMGSPATPLRRARLQHARNSPKLKHHPFSVDHHPDSSDDDDDLGVAGSDTVHKQTKISKSDLKSSTTPSGSRVGTPTKYSSNSQRCKLSKLQAEAFSKPLHHGATPSLIDTNDNTNSASLEARPKDALATPSNTNKIAKQLSDSETLHQRRIEGEEGGDKGSATPLRVGFYEIERTIGRGNFAIVKLARHRITRTEVSNDLKRSISVNLIKKYEFSYTVFPWK